MQNSKFSSMARLAQGGKIQNILRITNIPELRITNYGTSRIRNSQKFVIRRGARERDGFTMFEAAVVMAVLILITAVVLANLPNFRQRIALRRSTQELALAIRRAQNMAFTVRRVNTSRCGLVTPPAFGVYVTTANPGQYLIFADLRQGASCNGNFDQRYQSSEDHVIETGLLQPLISISEIRSDIGQGGNNRAEEVLNIVFTNPGAIMSLKDNSAALVGASARVTLSGQIQGLTKQVEVWTTGLVSTQ